MKSFLISSFLALLSCSAVSAPFTIAIGGKARCVIVQQSGATAPEQHAVKELALHLQKISGAKFQIQSNVFEISKSAIIIGQGTVASNLFPEIDFSKLGREEFIIRVKDGKLLLAGGRPRGTIYAVNRFLQEQCGVRWWTPWATNIPRRATLRIEDLNLRGNPAFEYRGPFWFPGLDPLWRARNGGNNQSQEIPAELGGCIKYKGYAHTFYPLVPPEKYFAEHPEWYSLVNGKRTRERAQLCLTNPKLREFVVERVKEWLRECPDCEIISVTQNDWHGWCECENCKALDDAEESHAGTMISFANYVAEQIEAEFPNVAVDTFAYQYTRKPPKTVRSRPNVIVRLCSIECNFRQPLDHVSNAAFLADLEGWAKICQRLYIWDYTTDFKNYIRPHPNWFTLGENVRLFQKYGVKGVFEQGAYASHGAEMAELREWVLAQLLWNPQQDDRALIREFLDGYYGKAASPYIYQYFELMFERSENTYLGCYTRKGYPFLKFKTLQEAERLWQKAEQAARKDSDREKILRIRLAHLPVRHVWLTDWVSLRRNCWEQNGEWPLSESRKKVAEQWRDVAKGVPGKDWTQARILNEGGLKAEDFIKQYLSEVPDTNGPPPPKRLANPPPPADLKNVSSACVDLQDKLATLYKRGEFSDILPDRTASDLRAVRMPGDHSEWAFRIPGAKILPKTKTGQWKMYAVVRVETNENAKPDSIAFEAGVYDNEAKNYPAGAKFRISDVAESYHSYLIGTFESNQNRDIFVSPASNPGIKAIWVDRIYLVPVRE